MHFWWKTQVANTGCRPKHRLGLGLGLGPDPRPKPKCLDLVQTLSCNQIGTQANHHVSNDARSINNSRRNLIKEELSTLFVIHLDHVKNPWVKEMLRICARVGWANSNNAKAYFWIPNKFNLFILKTYQFLGQVNSL